MKKQYRLSELDCANCAAKMEIAVRRVDGVRAASVNFMLQRLTVEADDARFEQVMEDVRRACRKIEPDCQLRG